MPASSTPAWEPLCSHFGDQVLAVEVGAVMGGHAHEVAAAHPDGRGFAFEHLAAAQDFLGTQLGIALALVLRQEVFTVQHHVAGAAVRHGRRLLELHGALL
jgi:hypothetical protein